MADRCEYCYYWKPESSTSSWGKCDRINKDRKWNECCEKFAR